MADPVKEDEGVDWHRRVVGRSLSGATQRSIDRGARLIRAAAKVLERTNGESLTVQDVADEAGQSLRTLYQYFASKDDLLLAVYEEAMWTYARLIRAAIAELDDPVERLAGALIASSRMPALHGKAGVDRGLTQLRIQLGQAEPELVAKSQAPVTAVFQELVEQAMATTPDADLGAEPATFLIASQRTSFVMAITLGNEYGVEPPDAADFARFCLGGLGMPRPRVWFDDLDARLALTGTDGRSILRRLAKAPTAS